MKFTKMHGLGNDYICVNGFQETISVPGKTAVKLCKQHFGIGADGLLLVLPSKEADFKMELYNSDGSRAKMCGNGIRCLGKYVFDKGLTSKKELCIETLSGLRNIVLYVFSGVVKKVLVEMGTPILNAKSIPICSEKNVVFREPIQVSNKEFLMTGVSMGNPHAVIFVSELQNLPMNKLGMGFEFHPRFPDRTNIEFCKIINEHEIEIRVWERGVGETLACGTGACAATVASVLNGFTKREVIVNLPGGKLNVKWDTESNCVFLSGEVRTVFEGEINEII